MFCKIIIEKTVLCLITDTITLNTYNLKSEQAPPVIEPLNCGKSFVTKTNETLLNQL